MIAGTTRNHAARRHGRGAYDVVRARASPMIRSTPLSLYLARCTPTKPFDYLLLPALHSRHIRGDAVQLHTGCRGSAASETTFAAWMMFSLDKQASFVDIVLLLGRGSAAVAAHGSA
jgi:hypothetical protein